MPEEGRALDTTPHNFADREPAKERLARLNECLLGFGVDPSENINRLVALCGEELGGACALYNRLEDGRLSAWGRWNVPADFNPVDKPDGHICYGVIQGSRPEPCVIRNLPQTVYARTDPNVLRYGLKTYVGKPVSFGKAFVGSLCVLYGEDRVPSEEDLAFLEIVASAIGVEERRKRAEAALRESQGRLRTILDKVQIGVLIIDPVAHTIVEVNPAAAHLIGAPPDQLVGKTCHKYVCPADVGRCPITDLQQQVDNSERVLLQADGGSRQILKTVISVILDGRPHLLESFVDITLQKEAEAALRGRTQQLEAVRVVSEEITRELNLTALLRLIIDRALGLVDAPAGVIYLWDRETEVLVPQAWLGYGDWIREVRLHLGEGVTGVAAQRQEGMIVNDYHSSPYALPILHERMGATAALVEPLLYRGHLLGAITANRIAAQREFTEKDQDILRLLAAQAAIAIENARLYRQVQDHAGSLERRMEERTHALKEAQAELVQSLKLAAVGTLAAGVAHELNQPLTIIRGYTQWLMGGEGFAAEAKAAIEQMQAQAMRMAKIINHLRDFSRQTKGTYETTALNEVVEATFLMLRQQLRVRNIDVVEALEPNLPAIRGDRFQLEQVFINLITNARDAMQPQGGGTLTVTTRTVADWVEVGLEDTGPGVPAEIRDRIFDPFFTTKEVGQGTGLGLSISYGIIREHGGEIRVGNRPEGGAEFVVRLPIPPAPKACAK